MRAAITLLYVTLLPSLLIALAESEIQVSALKSAYDGEHLYLSGNVLIEHAFGSLASDRARTLSVRDQRDQRVILEDNVLISLTDGGALTCGQAVLDTKKMRGDFFAGNRDSLVIYQGFSEDRQGQLTSLEFSSRTMALAMDRLDETSNYQVKAVDAEGQVSILYGSGIRASADYANYTHAGRHCPHTEFPGIVTLWPKPGKLCSVLRGKHDRIQAKKIRIDTIGHQLSFSLASGEFLLMKDAVPFDRIRFRAEQLQWFEKEEKLLLRGDVRFEEREMGVIIAEDQVTVRFHWINGKRDLRDVISQGPTRIIYYDDENGSERIVECPGRIVIDHLEKRATLVGLESGPANSSQIHYLDQVGELYANQATLWYKEHEEQPQLNKLLLEGNVRMRNTASLDPTDSTPVLQYAWSDQALFLPQRRLLTLSSETAGRVLFYDKLRNLKMSAPGIQVRRDGSSGKKTVQGLGNVRFTFAQQETQKLKQLFQFDEPSPENTLPEENE